MTSWFGGVRFVRGVPAGLVAIAVGTLVAWARPGWVSTTAA